MDLVVGEIEEKGALIARVKQVDDAIGQVVRQIGAFGHVDVFEWGNGPRAKVAPAAGRTLMRTADVLLEAVVFGQVALTAHMPLAYVPRLVAAFA